MMTNASAEQRRTRPISRDAAFPLRPPPHGSLVPTTPVRVTPTHSGVEWLPAVSERAEFDLGLTFVRNAVARSREDARRYPDSARAHANLAQAYWQASDMDAAAAHCDIALSRDPAHYVAKLLLARVREVQGRTSEATALYEEIHRARPSDTLALIGLANAAVRRDDHQGALRYLTQVTEIDASDAVARFYLGMVLLRLRRPHEAIAHLKHATLTDVRSPVLHQALGLAYWSQGTKRRAEQHFRTAVHLLPSYAPAVRSLAHLLILDGKPDKAILVLETYLAAYTENDAIRELLGWALFDKHDYRHALNQLKIAASLLERTGSSPRDRSRVANNIGVCFSRLNDTVNAATWYERALSLERDQPEAIRNLARLYLDTDRAEQAMLLIQGRRQLTPDDLETRFLLAVAASSLGRTDEAIAELEQIVRAEAAPAAAFSFLGTLLADDADAAADAVSILKEGRRRYPLDSMLANNLAYALLLAGQTAEGRAVLSAYPEDSVTDVYLRATWGLLHLREGDIQSGVEGYKEAQRLAESLGRRDLSRQARQKMHLELARYHLDAGSPDAAAQEVAFGLGIHGRSAYERWLRRIQRLLPDRT